MLKIYFGDMDGAINNVPAYFREHYDSEWLQDPEVKQMVRDIDRSEVLDDGMIDSPFLGPIPPTKLSGGVMTLILMDKASDKVFRAGNCGDNCAEWILRIGREKDVAINLGHIVDFGSTPFEIEVLNTGEIVRSMKELLDAAWKYI